MAHAATQDLLLSSSKIAVVSGPKGKVRVEAEWQGPIGTPAPGDATVRIAGGPGEGDSGLIVLPAEHWTVRKHGTVLR